MRKTLLLFIICAGLLLFAACSRQADDPVISAGQIGVRGEITLRTENQNGTLTILVEGDKEDDTLYDKASVTLTKYTPVTKGEEEASMDDLQVGTNVEAVMDGPVLESYPVQGGAASVTILDK